MEKTSLNNPVDTDDEKLNRMMKLIAKMNIDPEKAYTKEDIIRLREENKNKKEKIISNI
jgi:hypothetical protein